MGCLKLTYSDFEPVLKVVHKNLKISSKSCEGSYRFGYNGMEYDDAIKTDKNSYTTEFRQYDPRLGRWMSLDPLMAQFPWMSPYVAFNNNPIYFIDPYGLEGTGIGDKPKRGRVHGNYHPGRGRMNRGWFKNAIGQFARKVYGIVRKLSGSKHSGVPLSLGNRRETQVETYTITIPAGDTEGFLHLLKTGGGNGTLPSDKVWRITAETTTGSWKEVRELGRSPNFRITSWDGDKYKWENIGLKGNIWGLIANEIGTGFSINLGSARLINFTPILMVFAVKAVVYSFSSGIGLMAKMIQGTMAIAGSALGIGTFNVHHQMISTVPFWARDASFLRIQTDGMKTQTLTIKVTVRRIGAKQRFLSRIMNWW